MGGGVFGVDMDMEGGGRGGGDGYMVGWFGVVDMKAGRWSLMVCKERRLEDVTTIRLAILRLVDCAVGFA